jgi:hypothetical protein
MRTYQASTEIDARPSAVIDVLTDPEAARSWSPVDFEIEANEHARLRSGTRMEVGGRVAGREVRFDLAVHEASRTHLSLTASGPFEMRARYDAREIETGTVLRASVSVASSGGIRGRLVSSAAEALLSAGALERAMERIARSAAVAAA